MLKVTMFNTEEDLQTLTGLNHDELWGAGFDLDDWDLGIKTDRKLEAYDYGTVEYQLLRMIEACRIDYRLTIYKDKCYYMLYH